MCYLPYNHTWYMIHITVNFHSLQALDMMRSSIPKMMHLANNSVVVLTDTHAQPSKGGKPLSTSDDFAVRFWFAILFGLKEVVMKSDDLEVRTRYGNDGLISSPKMHAQHGLIR